MKIILIIVATVVVGIIAFLIYRSIVFRKERQKNAELKYERIKPLHEKLENGEQPSPEQIETFVKEVKTRETTYQLLKEHNKTDLFPREYYTIEKAAESNLVNWLEFPTELDAAPDEIEYLKKTIIDFDGNNVIYHVYKFRVNEPHWAAKDGWMLGVVGPYFDDSNPYDFPAATFSRLSKIDDINPDDEVKWVHENISMRN